MTSNCHKFFLDIEPVPTPRPRVSKFGVSYPKSYAEFKEQALSILTSKELTTLSHLEQEYYEVDIKCVCSKPKTGKLLYPRADVDNYAKAVLDVMTKAGIFIDDNRVQKLTVSKQYADEHTAKGIYVQICIK